MTLKINKILISILLISILGGFTPRENTFSYAFSQSQDLGVEVLMTLESDWATINSKPYQLEQAPILHHGRTMVPIRFIAEALGLEVSWDANTRTITLDKDTDQIKLFVDQYTVDMNGKGLEIDVPPMILNDRTVVPVRFISEILGYQVGWEESTSEVRISGKKTEDGIEYGYAQEVVRLVNMERENYGLLPLSMWDELLHVAKVKSQDLVDLNYFSHTSPTYGGMRELLDHYSISYRWAGENLATGQKTPESVVNAWMNSEGHKSNILNPEFNKIGVGVVAGGKYGGYTWTQIFTN